MSKLYALLLLPAIVCAQSQEFTEQMYFGDYYSSDLFGYSRLKGCVKSIVSKNFDLHPFYSEKNSFKAEYDTVNGKCFPTAYCYELNPDGKLQYRYYLRDDGTESLTDEYIYDDCGHEIIYTQYLSNEVYTEKFFYDGDKLKEKWIASSIHPIFFLKEKYEYDNRGLIVKSLNINNNVEVLPYFRCKGGIPDSDAITNYFYNNDGQLTGTETLKFEYREKFNGPPDESQFKLEDSCHYIYKKGKKIKQEEISFEHQGQKSGYRTTTVLNYDTHQNLVSKKRKSGKIISENTFYKNGKITRIESLYKNRICSIHYFDADGILYKIEEILKNQITESKFYNHGWLICEIGRNGIINYEIRFDNNGNWVMYSKYKDCTLIGEKRREISYYN